MKKFFDFLMKPISSYFIGFLGLFCVAFGSFFYDFDVPSIFAGMSLFVFVSLIVFEVVEFIIKKRNSPPSGEDK